MISTMLHDVCYFICCEPSKLSSVNLRNICSCVSYIPRIIFSPYKDCYRLTELQYLFKEIISFF